MPQQVNIQLTDFLVFRCIARLIICWGYSSPTYNWLGPPHLVLRAGWLGQAQSDFLNVLWSRFSSFHTLVRVVAWILRLTKKTGHPKPDLLSSKETSKAKALIFRLAQLHFLPEVFLSTINKTQLPRNHGLHRPVISLADAGHLVVHSRFGPPLRLAHTYYIPNLRYLLKQVSRSCPSCQSLCSAAPPPNGYATIL